jgi:murein endopeptidase
VAGGRWVEHFVIPGERLAEIATRYAVEVARIVEWNSLDAGKPMLRVGQKLRVLTRSTAAPRKRERYRVLAGDNWAKIARRYDVDVKKLQKQWNPEMGDLQPGDHVIVWIERDGAGSGAVEQEEPEPPATISTKLAAVAPPPHVANANLAATLASVVELKPSSATPTSGQPQPVAVPSSKPQPVAVRSSKPQPVAVQSSSKPQPLAVPSSKSYPVAPAPKALSTKFASSQTTSMQATLAAIVQPKAATQSASAKDPKLVLAMVTEPKPSARGVQPAPKVSPAVPTGRDAFPVIAVAPGGCSIGTPTRGHLRNGVQLPENPKLYTVRNPEHSWGTSLAVESLQHGMAIFRQQTHFSREIWICDMSMHGGGRFRPHRSHTSGRDVDIRLPLRGGVPADTIPEDPSVVDWDAAWQLVKSLVATGQVHYIFLARSRQVPLYKAALHAGETEAALAELMQYPGRGRNTLLRHSAGHTKHIHVRWKCAPDETQCVDP